MKVLVAFNTPTRRFKPGDDVTSADVDGPLTFEQRQELGHIETEAAPPKPAKIKE